MLLCCSGNRRFLWTSGVLQMKLSLSCGITKYVWSLLTQNACEGTRWHTFQRSFNLTYLSTNREQNLPIQPFSTFLGCCTNHLWVPFSFPCKTPNYVWYKLYYAFIYANIVRHACPTAEGSTSRAAAPGFRGEDANSLGFHILADDHLY